MKTIRTDRLPSTILIVESDPLLLTALGSMVDLQGHRAILARTEQVAVQALGRRPIDVIVLSIADLEVGCQFAERLRAEPVTHDIPIIFLVPQQNPAWTEKLRQQGGVYSLLKPYEPDALWELIEKTLWMPHVAQARMHPPKSSHLQQRDWVSLND